jgi:hypothetical protein
VVWGGAATSKDLPNVVTQEEQQQTSDAAEPEGEVRGEPPGFDFFLVHRRKKFDAGSCGEGCIGKSAAVGQRSGK